MHSGGGFTDRYGPWALVAGASEGIGAAWARALAARGLNLFLVARRAEPLAALAGELPTRTVTVAADLSTLDGLEAVYAATAGHDIGLLVANAALSPAGSFVDAEPAALQRMLDLNCRAPLLLARHYLPAMVGRGRGGLIIMASLAGQQGSPGLATYAATKAFDTVLAEGLWGELRRGGVDVLTCTPGAVQTPGLARASSTRPPGTVDPDTVVAAALRALGRRPRTVPGRLMQVSSVVMSRLLPRRTAINAMGRASRNLS
ncbi:SDR family NAD(P)-dependent oxidoreductase [Phytohabitans rumicis]|uniref:Short-chain dehydrogenase n=1 Tax=Phytohabitans rumicis TaxID=1076125 RepID=A0A6V8LI35_9ACTN|nr:SDR family NAD(P)-dependent oxidoreductase [Phytohabitans rumicis]GFJ95220.1 short-chain dehydrogenase [Phytohabitans rumicis]